jgi:long-chain acyl-CoA synthetase
LFSHPAQTLLSAFLDQARQCPQRTAISSSGTARTYAELQRAIARIASAVLLDPKQAPHVALILETGPEYGAAVYGIWAARGVVVGLNTSLKPDDLIWQARHCQAQVILVDGKQPLLATALRDAGLDVIDISGMSLWADGDCQVQALQESPQVPIESAAAIIYTSGTTGAPKGVVLSHANLAANAASIQRALPIRPTDIALCPLPFFYAYGFSVLLSHLSLGATLLIETSMMYPLKVLERMRDAQVTALYGVPSTYYLLLERGHLAHAASHGWLASLRYCAQAGGAMDPDRIDSLGSILPATQFFAMYGQTEASSRLTTMPSEHSRERRGSAGRAIEGVTLAIRSSEDGQVLPAGFDGEVCAQGPNIMQGYWLASEDTARTLRDGWLWTGDVGHLDAEGYLYLTGRSREMIKTGAHRVSPWEIEQVLQSVPGVEEAAVIAAPDHLLGEVIQACILAPNSDHDVLRRQIMQACKSSLAPYKVPKYVVFVGELPRTASGKVKKHLLPIHPQPGHPHAS